MNTLVDLDRSPVATVLRSYLAEVGPWEGTCQALLDMLPCSHSPATARTLSVHLKQFAPGLRKVGIDVRFRRTNAARLVTIIPCFEGPMDLPDPDAGKITIDEKRGVCTLRFNYPYEIDLAHIRTEADLLSLIHRLSRESWMTANRLRGVIDAIARHKQLMLYGVVQQRKNPWLSVMSIPMAFRSPGTPNQ